MVEKTAKCYYKEGSRDGAWYKDLPVDENGKTTIPPGVPFLQEGALLRIADSLELMTKDKAELEKEIVSLKSEVKFADSYRTRLLSLQTDYEKLILSARALRGWIARLKK